MIFGRHRISEPQGIEIVRGRSRVRVPGILPAEYRRPSVGSAYLPLLTNSPLFVAIPALGAWSDAAGTTPAVADGPVGRIFTQGSLTWPSGAQQVSAANRPTLRGAGLNGRPAIQFVVDDWLEAVAIDRHAGGVVIYQAFSVPTLYSADFLCQLVLRDSAALPSDPRRYEQTGWATGGNAGNFANWVTGTAHTTSRPTTPMIFEIRLTAGDVIRFRKSGLADDSSAGTMTALAFDSLAIGANWSSSTPFAPIHDMVFGGIGIYPDSVIDTQAKRDAMYQSWREAFGL